MENNPSAPEVELRSSTAKPLRGHAIELLKLGHGKLDAASYAASQEEDITGKLKESIESLIEVDADAPAWVDRYTVYDEEKPSGTPKLGKRRPRIDITIKRHWKLRESHPRFRFESQTPESGQTDHSIFWQGRHWMFPAWILIR